MICCDTWDLLRNAWSVGSCNYTSARPIILVKRNLWSFPRWYLSCIHANLRFETSAGSHADMLLTISLNKMRVTCSAGHTVQKDVFSIIRIKLISHVRFNVAVSFILKHTPHLRVFCCHHLYRITCVKGTNHLLVAGSITPCTSKKRHFICCSLLKPNVFSPNRTFWAEQRNSSRGIMDSNRVISAKVHFMLL